MQERVVDIATRDGNMNTYIFHPDGPGPHPVVIHYMDSVGIREELSDMCRRLATVGYYVLLPNLYYRKARYVDLDANRLRDPAYTEKLELMWTLNRSLTNTMIVEDTESMLSFIDQDPVARSEGIGVAFGVAARAGAQGPMIIDAAKHAFVDGWVQSMWLGVGMAAVAFAYLMVRGPVRTAVVVPDELPEAVSVGAVAD